MNPILNFLLGPVLDKILKYIPDPQQKAQAQLELLQLQQSAEFKEIDAAIALGQQQSDVNKVEAASTRLFIAGWRPYVGWICGTGLGLQCIVAPFLTWFSAVIGHPTPFPTFDNVLLQATLAGMLGLGFSLRSAEKITGKA
jgi:hypothetical protein